MVGTTVPRKRDTMAQVRVNKIFGINGPAREILVLIAYKQNAHADVSSGARDLKFGTCFHLHPYFVRASSEGSGETEHLHSLA